MHILQASQQPVWGVAFSADGRWLAAGGGRADVRGWDLSSRAQPVRLPRSQEALALAFNSNGHLLLANQDQPPRALRWPGGEVVNSADAFPVYAPYNVAFTPDGRVIQGTHDHLGCWDPVTGEKFWEGRPGGAWGRMACGVGACLAVNTDFRRLHRWDRVLGVCTATEELPPDVEGGVLALAFSPDGQTLAVTAAFQVMLWDVADWKERGRLRMPAPCTTLAFRPDGSVMLGDNRGGLHLWQADLGRELATYDFGVGAALSLAFDPEGARAVAGGPRGRIVVWNVG